MAMEAPEVAEESEEATSGLKRGSGGGGVSTPSTPSFNDDQGMTWELLMILGLVLLFISPVGEWLAGVVREITTHHNMNLDFNPLHTGTQIQPGTGVAGSSGGGGSNAAIGHYTVNLAGGGQMTVNASSPQAAVENVSAEGGKPA